MPQIPRFPQQRPTFQWNVPPQRLLRYAALLLLVIFLVCVVSFGFAGITEVKDHQVAVFVNYLTGTMEVDPVPGNKLYFPIIQEVFTLDKSANKFVMEGKDDVNTDHVRELTVRARDGSNFWFDTIELQYQLVPGKAAEIIQGSGTEDAFKKFWLMAYARSVLRDEFGKFDPDEISSPTHYTTARAEAQKRLNELLSPHGIEVIQISVPKPKFASEYEKAIEDRKLADQEVERLKAKALQLEKEKAKRLAEIASTKGQEYAALKGTLAAGKTSAEAEQIKLQRAADAYKIQRAGEGEAERLSKIEEARGQVEKNRKEAEGLLVKAEALAKQGRWVVIEALAKKFEAIQIEMVPYQKRESPDRLEFEPSAPKAVPTTGGK